jgi:tRNA pseudouridine38-40 synthase
MQSRPFTYLFYIQYLGIRYHGWQVQPGVRTVQGTLHKAIRYLLGHEDFNILGASRTDAGVSCEKGAFELFLKTELDVQSFLKNLNSNLPADIRVFGGHPVSLGFNIIQDVSEKEYCYYFSFGLKFHPFQSATMAYFDGDFGVDLLRSAAEKFNGKHDFRNFCHGGKEEMDCVREIFSSHLELVGPLDMDKPNAQQVYRYRVSGKGFLMHQVRHMVGAMLMVGNGSIAIDELHAALELKSDLRPWVKVPANGLVLNNIRFTGL